MEQQKIEAVYNSRFRKADVGLATNKLKVKSIKTLKDGLLTGKKSHEQLIAAYVILLLVKEYEQSI
jgi:hypothetical protein